MTPNQEAMLKIKQAFPKENYITNRDKIKSQVDRVFNCFLSHADKVNSIKIRNKYTKHYSFYLEIAFTENKNKRKGNFPVRIN